MAFVGDFNADAQDYSVLDYSPLPVGEYVVVLTESEFQKTRDLSGEYMNCKFVVVEGKYANRIIWHMLNLKNKSADTVRRANAELGKIVKSVGLQTIRNTQECHNKPLVLEVGVQPAKDGYPAKNKVTGFMSVSEYRAKQGGAQVAPAQATVAPAQPAQVQQQAAAWRSQAPQPAPESVKPQEEPLQNEIF